MTTKLLQKLLNANKNSADVQLLQKKLNEVRKNRHSESSFTKKTSFAPSSLGYYGRCPRYWYYAFHGATFVNKWNGPSAAAMKNGINRHTELQQDYADANVEAQAEVPLHLEDPPIKAFADEIIVLDGKKIVVEIKTIKDDNYVRLENTMKPVQAHYLQLLIYMHITGIKDGILHYENKDTHHELFFPVQYTERAEKYIEKVLEWMRNVKSSVVDDNIMPERSFTKKSMVCKYCPVFSTCYKTDKLVDGNAIIDPLTLENL